MNYTCHRNPKRATNSLLKLLPWGDFIFNRNPQSNWYKLCAGLGEQQADFEQRRCELMHDVLPINTCEFLADWEATYSLPKPCATMPEGKDARRRQLLSHHTATAGFTFDNGTRGSSAAPAYLEWLAAQAGYDIDIKPSRPFRYCRETYCDHYGCPGTLHIYVNGTNDEDVNEEAFSSCDSTSCDAICSQNLAGIECLMEQYAPARFELRYHYP